MKGGETGRREEEAHTVSKEAREVLCVGDGRSVSATIREKNREASVCAKETSVGKKEDICSK